MKKFLLIICAYTLFFNLQTFALEEVALELESQPTYAADISESKQQISEKTLREIFPSTN